MHLNPNNKNRLSPVFTSNSSRKVFLEIERLQDLYKASHKRKLSTQLLFSAWEESGKPKFGISLEWENKNQLTEVNWIKDNLALD